MNQCFFSYTLACRVDHVPSIGWRMTVGRGNSLGWAICTPTKSGSERSILPLGSKKDFSIVGYSVSLGHTGPTNISTLTFVSFTRKFGAEGCWNISPRWGQENQTALRHTTTLRPGINFFLPAGLGKVVEDPVEIYRFFSRLRTCQYITVLEVTPDHSRGRCTNLQHHSDQWVFHLRESLCTNLRHRTGPVGFPHNHGFVQFRNFNRVMDYNIMFVYKYTYTRRFPQSCGVPQIIQVMDDHDLAT